MRDALYVRPAGGPCDAHAWPDAGLAARIVLAARRRTSSGAVNVCRPCIARVRRSAPRPLPVPFPPEPVNRVKVFDDWWAEVKRAAREAVR